MKTFLTRPFWGLILLLIFFVSCDKEADIPSLEDLPYEQRLEGIWDLKAVTFSTQIPNPQNPLQTIDIEGEGEDVSGLFVLSHDPNNLDYRYEFTANLSLADSLPAVPVPVEREASGSWSATSDESRIFVTEEDQTAYTFIVKENSLNRQVYETTFEETIMGIFTIEVDVSLQFERR